MGEANAADPTTKSSPPTADPLRERTVTPYPATSSAVDAADAESATGSAADAAPPTADRCRTLLPPHAAAAPPPPPASRRPRELAAAATSAGQTPAAGARRLPSCRIWRRGGRGHRCRLRRPARERDQTLSPRRVVLVALSPRRVVVGPTGSAQFVGALFFLKKYRHQ